MKKKKNATLKLRILLSIFALNSITLYLYYFSRPDYLRHRNGAHFAGILKPWPNLPSFFPWEGIKEVPFGSCEAYFGNGFTRRVDALKKGSPESRRKMGPAAGGGWFRCFYSETLQSSVCEGGEIRMNVGRIRMSRGGEELPAVIGRAEEEELPEFEDGAFEIEVVGKGGIGNGNGNGKKLVDEEFLDRYVPNGVVDTHTMRGLIDSIRLVGSDEFRCDEWIEEPTLLVTRFEYANLFHTFTDWYSAYVASRVTGLPNRPQLVFVDGHCKTQLEETWNALFSSLRYAKSFNGSVCFRHAILAPLGYETALFKGLTEDIDCDGASADELRQNPDDHKTARLSEFGEMIKAAFDLPVITDDVSNPLINILFVRREDYLAHPRHGGKVQSRLTNEEEVFDSLRNMVASSDNFTCELNITNGLFAHMSMKEQIQAISGASVISGAHGAGLTHIISAAPKTVVLEVVSSEFRRPHFALIAKWRGLEYHPIYLDGSTANPLVVVEKLRSILRNLGC